MFGEDLAQPVLAQEHFPGNNEALRQGEGPVHQLTSSNRNPSLDVSLFSILEAAG